MQFSVLLNSLFVLWRELSNDIIFFLIYIYLLIVIYITLNLKVPGFTPKKINLSLYASSVPFFFSFSTTYLF